MCNFQISIVIIMFFGLFALATAMPMPVVNQAIVPVTYSGYPVQGYSYPYSTFYGGYPYGYSGIHSYGYTGTQPYGNIKTQTYGHTGTQQYG